jgi:hypothetical protein
MYTFLFKNRTALYQQLQCDFEEAQSSKNSDSHIAVQQVFA